MWLRYAVNDTGELVYIEQVKRGRTDLHCPYCNGLLTAKKGQQIAAHFAHTGETCRQVDRDNDLDLPAYDNFNLHLPGKVLHALQQWDADNAAQVELNALLRYDLVSHNDFARVNQWQLTKRGKIPLGKLSLGLFCEVQEPLIAARHGELETMAADVYDRPGLETIIASEKYYSEAATAARTRLHNAAGMDIDTALADLRIYRAQWRRILGLKLYFLDINSGQYHKIGVTARSMAERLAEIKADLLPLLGNVQVTVIDTFDHRGNVELYFKHRYAANAVQLGTLTEYYKFDNAKPVITELRRMKDKALSDLEQAVLSGLTADIERRIKHDEMGTKRRAAIAKGLSRAQDRGHKIGRPLTSDESLLEKYSAVAVALTDGLSLRKTAALTGVAINTVRKVQKALYG